MSETLIVLISGIILLLFSTRTLLRLSEVLSNSLRLSPLIIGMTIVAVGTSLPELSVSMIASISGDVSLAIGNIVGSNIINILLVFAVGILIGNLRIGSTKTPRNASILLILTILYSITHTYDIYSKQITGLFFVGSALLLTFLEYRWALFGRDHEDIEKFKKVKKIRFTVGKTIMLLLSIFGVIVGGYLIVNSTEKISLITGLSTGILGLTLTAIATSLPELLTTIFSQEEHDEKMTIGNILGSNIYNLLLIGGLIDIFSTSAGPTDINWSILNTVTILFVCLIFFFRGKVVPKSVGLILLLSFFGYLFWETKKLF